ncbi:hypothetical protein B0T25DRAFT_447527 [Lasiosphaeria hispida]|uniref:Uncharacterized protein n=1 Tax=Lasiosphaeria hispida TaxID=260671 RepID=A0AAJ0HP03_9PEZI|nr:hypothetical protein B0T25DRAFT_447527 [Lasiosphaeria hispida]
MLLTWAQHWSGCLDLLDKSVKVELGELANEDTSNDLMFDNSFGRSKAYFKALQILRIFADAIRETGRGVRGMSPEKLAWATHSKPDEDLDLLNNWKILWTSYLEAETRLLSRIAGKTEEIKGLRDGMFNATSLREASRSTTMNRYVIVFTIVTLLYLPPSLVAVRHYIPRFPWAWSHAS